LKILFVHRSSIDAIFQRMTEGIGALKCGMPWEQGEQ
jgi:hypothetical protein